MISVDYRDFLRKIENALLDSSSKEANMALMLLDLSELAEMDGVLGYAMVDTFVEQAMIRVKEVLPETDIVTGIGRHQLACFFTNLPSLGHAELAAQKILRTLDAPFVQGKRNLMISARVGIALVEDKRNSAELLRQANSAVHQALREKSVLNIYTPEVDAVILSELDLLTDLDLAIEQSRIFLMYQPHLDIKSGKIVGSEALLRWTHPERGVIPPNSMVRLAERAGLISKLTYWVFNTAVRQCAEYRAAGFDIGVSINFSAINLREPDLVDIVEQCLCLWDVPSHQVTIELTETAIMEENKQTLEVLNQFKAMGLEISMDDFGTGYSSMALLQKLPIDEIKIDLSFTRAMTQRPESEKMVDSIISLAHKLGMCVVAEGVEDKDVLYRLKAMGCDVIQGYIIGKPMLLDDFIKTCRHYEEQPYLFETPLLVS